MMIYFIRHGNTFNDTELARQVGCKTNLPLTKRGEEQIHTLKKHFISNNIDFYNYYCGPLTRHIQSAKILSKQHKINIVQELNEIDYGTWENLTSAEIQNKWPNEYKKWQEQAIWPSQIFYGDESTHINNLKLLITNISYNNSTDSNILVMSSQGIIRYLLYLSGDWPNIVKHKKIQEYKVSPSNYCIVETNKENVNIISWNNSTT